ncbi:hypothetical protein [Plantibacter sp. Leaf314]|uniref:hypothetical protein n=1 Tax=Plantibacter sp. Leaf314 TaxID=1736333 RepID=UPI0006F7CDE7|nr:hypothetical protein [Plantibacter sp. Leaf314]KQQ51787.1 hypothetical protein ASF68_05055 [Plantibacter sp. Leaf314]
MTDVPPPDPQYPDGRPPQQPNPPRQPPQQNWGQQPNGQQPTWQQQPNPNPQQNWQQQPNGQQPTWQQQPTPQQQPQQPWQPQNPAGQQQPQQPWQQQNPYGQQPQQQNPYGQQPPQQPPYGPPKRKRTGLIIALAVGVPVVVIAAIITVVSLVLAQGGAPVADPSPTRSATPTKTASPTPSETDATPEPSKTYVSIPPDLDFAAGQEVPTEWTAYLTNDFDSSWAAGGKDKNGIDIYTNASTSCEVRLGNIALTQDEIAVGDDERSSDAYLAKYVGADYVKADGTTEQLNYNSGGGLIEFRVLSWTQASGERTYWGVRSLTKMGTLVVFTFTCRDQAALDQLASDVVNLISVELLPKR